MSFNIDRNKNIELTRGDTAEFDLDLKWRVIRGDVETITRYEPAAEDVITFTLRRAPKGIDGTPPILQKSPARVWDPVEERTKLVMTILPAETVGENYGQYFYDVQVCIGGDPTKIYTAVNRRFRIMGEAT